MSALIYFAPGDDGGGGGDGPTVIDGWAVPGTGGGVGGAGIGLDVDFRTITPIDLNGNAITFSDQGVTWSSPQAIDPAVDTFEIVAGVGLDIVVGANTRFSNTAQDAPHVWTRLQEIPSFSAAEEMLAMIEFANLSVTANTELVFVGNYAPNGDSGPASRLPASDARAISNGLGFANSSGNTIRLLEALSNTVFVSAPLGTNVLAIRFVTGGALQFMLGATDAEGNWPRPSELEDIGPFLAAANNQFEDEMWTNQAFNRIALGADQENLGAPMSVQIPRARFMLR